MRRPLPYVLLALAMLLCRPAAAEEQVIRTLVGGYDPSGISVNPTDGSCWVTDTNSSLVAHLSGDAEELWRGGAGGMYPSAVAVNPTDGSCWVGTGHSVTGGPDDPPGHVTHLSSTGQELWSSGTFGWVGSVSVNPVDGSCWVADPDNIAVVHLDSDGRELWRGGGFDRPSAVCVNPTDGSCWVADSGSGQVVHLSSAGGELWRGGSSSWGASISVNPSDGSCWVADTGNNQVVHLSSAGEELWRGGGFQCPRSISVNPTDGSCWVGDASDGEVTHLSSTGEELWRGGGFNCAKAVAVNPTDGSCWVGDSPYGGIVHLSSAGETLWQGGSFNEPRSVSTDGATGSCWVGGTNVVLLSRTGEQLLRVGGIDLPVSVSANSADGSCWVAGYGGSVVHLSAAGAELCRDGFNDPESVSANPTDGSCWVTERAYNDVVRLSADGLRVWQGAGFAWPCSVSVDPTDGSCWVADGGVWSTAERQYVGADLVHIAADGSELWRGGGIHGPSSVSVNPVDGSCWVADLYARQVAHLSAVGDELWRGGTSGDPRAISVNPTDGSWWVADGDDVAHLSPAGDELWRGGGFDNPQSVSVDPADGSCWVADYGNDRVVHLSLVRAYFSATPLAGTAPLDVSFQDLTVTTPTGPVTAWLWDFGDGTTSTEQNPTHRYTLVGTHAVSLTVTIGTWSDTTTRAGYLLVSFPDVPLDFWAMRGIVASVDAGIVQGYPDGSYWPNLVVTRDQMAVYIARALCGGDASAPTGAHAVTFTDVPADHWAFQYIEYCYDAQVVEGYADGYHPDETVNRAQMAVYIARSVVTPTGEAGLAAYTPPTTPSFPDVPTDYWAYKHIEYCKAQSIVNGYSDGYHPEETVTRAQMAVYVARAFELPM